MNTLKELYLEAARVAELIDGIDLSMGECFKFDGKQLFGIITFYDAPIRYEACLAIVEGKPVFKGDELYDHKNKAECERVIAGTFPIEWLAACSWSPSKPKTVMVELLVEDAEFMVDAYCVLERYKSKTSEVAEACRKALEGLKS